MPRAYKNTRVTFCLCLSVSVSACVNASTDLKATANPDLVEACSERWEPGPFRALTSSVWVRSFPTFVSGCGVYNASVTIVTSDLSSAGFDYQVCNGCQHEQTVPVAVVGTPGLPSFVQEQPSADGMWPVPEIIDEEGNRWVGACPVREVIITGEQTRRVRLTHISPGQALEGYKERSLVGTLYHDPSTRLSGSLYWENAVNFNLVSESAFLWPHLRNKEIPLSLSDARSDAAICQSVGLPSEIPKAEGDEGTDGYVRQIVDSFELPEELSFLLGR